MRFALVIPALNEEDAIAGTLRRALAARAKVTAATPVTEMKVVFVNDGSTDRTQEIVDGPEFKEVIKVNYGRNRGYGAAIKAGWHAADAELVGFIDGDGTCEPDFCINLINQMIASKADVVLAARLNPDTQMPLIRKIGNRIFATLLGVVSGRQLTDTASGFRIIKRESLRLMSPLPDGLHFTPAMSCICLLDPRLKIEEVHGMLYKEREGRSKLSVIKDGFRFLYTILFSACCYSPIKTMTGASALFLAFAGLLSLAVALLVSHKGGVAIAVLGLALAILAMTTGLITHQLNYLLIGPRRKVGPAERLLQWVADYKRLILSGMAVTSGAALGLLIMAGVAGFVGPEMFSVRAGLVTGSSLILLGILGGSMTLAGVVVRVVWAVGEKQKALIQDEYRLHEPPEPAEGMAGKTDYSMRASAKPQATP